MSNVLTRIIDSKQAHIAALKARFPEASLQPKVSDRSLKDALSGESAGFILECKKASPSKGLIRADFDPIAIAKVYDRYAAAVSVLTDEQYFQGDMDYIPRVRATISQPVLCKDFFISTYQVRLAAHQGADAILLMLSVLDDTQYRELAVEAAKYRLDTLTEVSNDEELERAIALGAPIIGINNRNLRDLSTDLATTEALAPRIPEGTLIISESGIYTQAQVRRLAPLVDGFLVGSSLMAEQDLDLACRRLIFGANKVCGLGREADLETVARAGGVYGGLIFAAKSPRAVDLTRARALCAANAKAQQRLAMVGVFVDTAPAEIAAIAGELKLAAVQLHGNESEADIASLRALLPQGTEIWKAVAVTNEPPGAIASSIPSAIPGNADRLLYDSQSAGQFGGTGISFDWQLDLQGRNEAMLAGGLNPANAAEAAGAGFRGLDFNSGLESAPGVKDPALIAAAFAALRRY
ncbi:bifunctional indole-3-glycerol-phosphate synthase TrpC/phosphoribosylanthranilate isomerase TrpF [Shewanella sedimentimangrovi]|uniref:Multifunctional fusion protein n=1 Tax=Shewanella sedimentimangrovi TaxID=2814293 RepID=A0ABX7QWP0_9GAMM|nr:bifunctional indole-3-glycerol-phosphate synthase TrpC/phosphoribosylanthranilate isomerase TrpF [Shewanella sedimentimangrovi]QSX35922.1 bifunctional indole-3-glycerol-phosphate synthase TrpC/phosphoribosylanthranilate isomerase TrpF [Shewanella sedimentimangrovi]